MGAAKKLVCGHMFHQTCLRSWLAHQTSCPICRRSTNGPPTRPTPTVTLGRGGPHTAAALGATSAPASTATAAAAPAATAGMGRGGSSSSLSSSLGRSTVRHVRHRSEILLSAAMAAAAAREQRPPGPVGPSLSSSDTVPTAARPAFRSARAGSLTSSGGVAAAAGVDATEAGPLPRPLGPAPLRCVRLRRMIAPRTVVTLMVWLGGVGPRERTRVGRPGASLGTLGRAFSGACAPPFAVNIFFYRTADDAGCRTAVSRRLSGSATTSRSASASNLAAGPPLTFPATSAVPSTPLMSDLGRPLRWPAVATHRRTHSSDAIAGARAADVPIGPSTGPDSTGSSSSSSSSSAGAWLEQVRDLCTRVCACVSSLTDFGCRR
jgi:hypothetical protein